MEHTSFEASDPTELLLIGSETSDPFATKIISPRNGVASWSFRGSELQGAVSGCVEPLGNEGDVIAISCKDRPLIHLLSVHPHKRRHLKSVVSGPITNLLSSLDGRLILASIGTQLFTWMVSTGELLTVLEAHYQRISCMCLAYDGKLVLLGADDGCVNAFHLAHVASWDIGTLDKPRPYREWRVHSLSVSAINSYRCSIDDSRVVSCSLDHTIALHSLKRDECLLKISGDEPLTACTMDTLGRFMMIGTNKGNVAMIKLFAKGTSRERVIVTSAGDTDELPVFVGHSAAVTRLTVNCNGMLLASGDSEGHYSVWDIRSRQCLISSQTRGAICKLSFVWNWSSIHDKDYTIPITSMTVLQRQRALKTEPRIVVVDPPRPGDVGIEHREREVRKRFKARCKYLMAQELWSKCIEKRKSEQNGETEMEVEDRKEALCDGTTNAPEGVEVSRNVLLLEAKVAELERVNKQLYKLAASVVLQDE